MFVDCYNAEDKVSCRSRSVFLIYANTTLVQWFSKKQSTIETSVFGAEFVSTKHGIDTLRHLRYKLRMIDIPISSPSYIYGDDVSVVHNKSRQESVLRKKSNSVCYHAVCESMAMGESLYTSKRMLVGKIFYDIHDNH